MPAKTGSVGRLHGSDISLTVTASRYIPINNFALSAGYRWIKLVSGSSEGADRTVILVTRPV